MTATPRSFRHVVAVVNPTAGRGRAGRRLATVRAALGDWPGRVAVESTRCAGDAEALAAAARQRGADLVVAVGGDGTVHEVVNGLLGAGVDEAPALGVVPLGTGCDFARNAGLSLATALLPPGAELRADVGRARYRSGLQVGERYFVNAANIGASTRAARRVNGSALLRRAGAAAYGIAAAPELLLRPTVEVAWRDANGSEGRADVLNVSVCNGARFGGGLSLVPTATLTDGTLHVARVARAGLGAVTATLLAAYGAGARERPGVEVTATTAWRLAGDAVLELDGEIPGRLPAEFQVVRAALRLAVPAEFEAAGGSV